MHGMRRTYVPLASNHASLHTNATLSSDSHVTQHVPHVRQTIANSNLLQYIQEAHKPHTNRLQASNPVSLNMSFFLQAEGQDESNTGELSPIRQHHGNRRSSDEDETDSRSSSESGLRSSNEDD
jgi:hypothetical protein